MNIVGIIPARGGSKGVKDKNILSIGGKPLIGYTIEAALTSKRIDKLIVSTDSDKIAGVVHNLYDIEVIKRPAELAQDTSPIEEAFLHALDFLKEKHNYVVDILVWMQPNVPIRKPGIIDEVIEKLIHSDADSCVTCYPADQIPEVMKVMNEQGRLVPFVPDSDGTRRQEFPVRYLLDGSVVALRAENIYRVKGIRKLHIYLGKDVIPVVQEKKMYSLEIDEPDDIPVVEYFLRK